MTKNQLQSRMQVLKAKFNIFNSIVLNSGFGWDDDLKVPTAPDRTWKEYLSSHPKAKEFRHRTLPNYELLKHLTI
jgi:hypothetical protein